jgi:T-complex protein 1 subunit theta
MAKAGVVDLLATKKQGIALALDAVATVLKVDQIIQAKPAGGPKLGKRPGQGHW